MNLTNEIKEAAVISNVLESEIGPLGIHIGMRYAIDNVQVTQSL